MIEYLPNPNILWNVASDVLAADGTVGCFTPNGEPPLETLYGTERYHRLWGEVHPLLLTSRALTAMSERYGFVPHMFSSPYTVIELDGVEIRDRRLAGDELLLVALRAGDTRAWADSARK